MNELALFAGAGGGILGGKLLGWNTVAAVERDAYAAAVLAKRQNEGLLDIFPIWSDVTSFDGRPWSRIVDVISGGFPCQDISVAGKGAGIEGARSGMWKEFLRIIGDIRPRFVFVENSPMLTSRGLGVVLGDLAAAGYDAEWMCLSAREVGANHERDRIWILAHSREYGSISNADRIRCGEFYKQEQELRCSVTANPGCDGETRSLANTKSMPSNASAHNGSDQPAVSEKPGAVGCKVSHSFSEGFEGKLFPFGYSQEFAIANSHDWWETEPKICRVVDGVAARLDFVNDQLKAIGNGQVPLAAATAFRELINRF